MDANIDTMGPSRLTSSVPILLNLNKPIRRPDSPIHPIREHLKIDVFFLVYLHIIDSSMDTSGSISHICLDFESR